MSRFLGVDFTPISKRDLIRFLVNYSSGCKYVVTPNADHIVRLVDDEDFRRSYSEAAFRVCDSKVLKGLAVLKGVNVGPVITGSDLTVDLLEYLNSQSGIVNIVGPTRNDIESLREVYKKITINSYYPPMGFIAVEEEVGKVVDFVSGCESGPMLLWVGSPQQELLAYRLKMDSTYSGCAICVGASIDFIVGKSKRAPRLMRLIGLEWLFRLASEPRRLGPRYFRSVYVLWLFFISFFGKSEF